VLVEAVAHLGADAVRDLKDLGLAGQVFDDLE
jgi:hypothetical protein